MDWLVVIRNSIHYGLHFIFPIGVAYFLFRSRWRKVSLIFLSTMLVDLDHLLASPIFDPGRCSIGFHYLHSHIAIVVYVVWLFIPKMRIIALGLIMHMLTDYQDCFWDL